MCLAALIGLDSITNVAAAQSFGTVAQLSALRKTVQGRIGPFVSWRVFVINRGSTLDSPQGRRPVYSAFHGHAAADMWTLNTAQRSATAAEVKAGLLINFTKFTEWPKDTLPSAAPLVLCVARSSTVQRVLEDITKGLAIRQHPLGAREVKLEGPFDGCHVLYVENLDAKRALELLRTLNGAPVLSVSDFKNFAQLGGSAHLFIEDGRMRFAVNLDATRRIELRLSSLS